MERADDAEFPDRAAAGAVVAVVVEVRSLEHRCQAILVRKGEEFAEQFPLAVVAPVGRVLGESGDVQFLGFNDHVADALRAAERRRLVQLALREGVRAYRGGHHALPQFLVCHAQEEGRVHARRKRHDRAPNDAHAFAELFKLRERLRVFLLA